MFFGQWSPPLLWWHPLSSSQSSSAASSKAKVLYFLWWRWWWCFWLSWWRLWRKNYEDQWIGSHIFFAMHPQTPNFTHDRYKEKPTQDKKASSDSKLGGVRDSREDSSPLLRKHPCRLWRGEDSGLSLVYFVFVWAFDVFVCFLLSVTREGLRFLVFCCCFVVFQCYIWVTEDSGLLFCFCCIVVLLFFVVVFDRKGLRFLAFFCCIVVFCCLIDFRCFLWVEEGWGFLLLLFFVVFVVCKEDSGFKLWKR